MTKPVVVVERKGSMAKRSVVDAATILRSTGLSRPSPCPSDCRDDPILVCVCYMSSCNLCEYDLGQ